MKKTIFAIAVMALASSAMANGYSAPSVVGNASSTVGGSAGSYSVVNGVNQTSAHGAFATASNEVCVTGSTYRGYFVSGAATGATATGSTVTGAGGVGLGGSSAVASQVGFGDVTATVKAPILASSTSAPSTASSNVAIGTFSNASNLNSGVALSGSNAAALNASGVVVGLKTTCLGGVCTNAKGFTGGIDTSSTWGGVVGGNETVDAGGLLSVGEKNPIGNVGSAQNGSFSGNVKVVNAPL